jgi:spore germination cell wall hydrolase CwlJ-like protein
MRKLISAIILAIPLVACSTETQPHTSYQNPVVYAEFIAERNKQIDCLTRTIWNEARGESWEGQYAVGAVVMNRVRSSGKSICQVVNAPGQFATERVPRSEMSSKLYQEIRNMALTVKADSATISNVRCAEFFWISGLMPQSLRGKVVLVNKIGKHSFYRYKDVSCGKVKIEKV